MRLADVYSEWPTLQRHEVDRLLMKALDVDRRDLVDLHLEPGDIAAFAELAHRRVCGEPLQYIEGSVQFGPVELIADPRGLIPRPETEQLWDRVVSRLEAPNVVVDLCTGSGNIALACKAQWRDARILATDLSEKAVALARENAAHNNLAVEVMHGDLFAPLPLTLRGVVDVIIANPPYLATAELDALPAEVRDHEPHSALVSGPSGDEVLAEIARLAPRWLAPGGLLACEISEFRSDDVAALFADLNGVVERDMSDRPRFVFGTNEVPDEHRAAIEALRSGEVIGIPTDTVYGIAADVFSRDGVDMIYKLKERDRSKPLPVLAADLAQAEEVAVFDDDARTAAADAWPGAVTFVVRRRPGAPQWIGDAKAGTVGVRVPDHDELRALMRRTGPLAATSANRSGDAEVLDDAAARAVFGSGVATYLPGVSPGGRPSAVIDMTSGTASTLRPG